MKLLEAILIPQDKANHIIDGAAIYMIVAFVGKMLGVPYHREIALAVCTAAGIGKEVYDWVLRRRAKKLGATPTTHVEGADVAVTFLGGFTCYAAGWLE